jgi:4-amino-4-deoxy-L-arabinose transferase-like glycosyltransferase
VAEEASSAARGEVREGIDSSIGARQPIFEIIAALGIFIIAALIFFFHLGTYGFWEPDEARYGEIAREMMALHDYIVPHLNYVAYVEKPPLLYWLTTLSYRVFGINEFAARMIPALSALLGVVATFFFAARTMGRRRAIMAAAILATAPLYAVMAQTLTTDMLLSSLITIAIFALLLHFQEGGIWCWIAYVAMGLATLTKGPIGIILPALTMLIFLCWERALDRALRRFHAIAGGTVVLAIVAPWFVAISLREPGFLDFYFVGEHLRRFFEPSFSHGEPFYFYVPVLLLGLLPWSLLVPFLTWRRMRKNPARRYCVIGAIAIIATFSTASGKLIPYVLPAFPLLAILLADGIVSCAWPEEPRALRSPDSRILMESGPLLGLLGAGVIFAALNAASFRTPYPLLVQPELYAIGGILLFGGAMVSVAFSARLTGAGLSLIVITLTGSLCAATWARIAAEPLRSYATLSRQVAERAPGAQIICYHRYVQGLPFYTHHRVILIGPPSELRFGEEHAPDASDYFFTSDSDLMRLWQRSSDMVLVLDASDLTRLKDRLGSFTVIAVEHTKRAIINHGEQLARD